MTKNSNRHPMQSFTDAFIKGLKPEPKRYVVREKAPRGEGGFCIRVTPNGAKGWYFVFSHIDRKGLGWCHLGDYPVMSLSRARDEFRKMRTLLKDGKDPIVATQEQRKERRDSWTVDTLCDEFLEKYSEVKKRPRSAHEDKLNLARDVRPTWGRRKAIDIRRGDVVTLLDEIVSRGSGIQANRTLATVRKMFAWALEREVVEFNPASGISKPADETPKERVLTLKEIKKVWETLENDNEVPSGVRKALQLLLLTGCRPGEILGAKWEQIKDNWLELPGTNTKNKKTHRVYLSTFAKRLLGEKEEGLIIKKGDGEGIPVYTLSFWLRRCNHFGTSHWTPHDLRRTCATMLAQARTAPHVVQRVLNHAPTGITGRHYDKHSYAPEVSQALEKLGQKVETAVYGNASKPKVVNISSR